MTKKTFTEFYKNNFYIFFLSFVQNPPNFTSKEDLKNYQTPIAIINSSQIGDDFLIDLSDNVREQLFHNR